MKISVIVAAYNAEKYLAETLDSITHQTIDDYEIIVINDGSSDSTLDILKNYQADYPNLHIIDKENGGPSSARNAGLDIAKGDYIYFFDADDILEAEALEHLYEAAVSNKADLVIAKYDIFNRYKTYPINNIDELITLDTIEKYDPLILWTFSLCNKLFKKSLIDQYNFRLPPVSYSEDGAFLMEYVYHTTKITGLNEVIFHYRRMYDGEAESITASVSPSKIKDYITAHQMILNSAQASILKDFPQYGSIEEVKQNEIEIRKYLNEIIRKELQVLLNQFYSKFWSLEEDIIQILLTEVQEKLEMLDMRSISLLMDAHPDLPLFHLTSNSEELLAQAHFTAALYGDAQNTEAFLDCLKTLTIQNLITLKILVPFSMRKAIKEAGLFHRNIVFADVSSENELFHYALDTASTPYITFCDAKTVYTNNAFKYIFKRFIKSPADFIAELIYHKNYGDAQPVFLNRIALNSLQAGLEYNPYLCLDYTLANKFFRVEFLKKQQLAPSESILSHLDTFYRTGYYAFMNDGIVIYEDTEESFTSYVSTDKSRAFIEEYMTDRPATLDSPEIVANPGESFTKLQLLPHETISQKLLIKAMERFKKQPLKNQVVFFSIRKNGKLEGNAKALYPHVKGEKVICAKQLPHGKLTEVRMFRELMTSKVIVTDDYVRYLRHFPLRPEQRVIQLWHACGAFKKFGQRGTNIALRTDMATHAQYNIVSVSGESVRPIYADAFNINLQKVKALGCPRTDDFFNQSLIAETRKSVYDKHPELKGKFVIIYAPTFRDIGGDRTEFHPELDFDRLSKELLPNQVFLICPHPVMKNSIIPKKYSNIRVMRDFSTNDLMHISDMLITDYSSVIFEYALLKKPIAFFCYDLVTYNRGFYLKYPGDLPGDVYENQSELTAYLRSPEKQKITEKHTTFVQKYMSACDGHSCERIAALINAYMEEN